MTDLQLQKDEVVVDMMEMREKEELVMEEVPEGQLVVAEPELLETNNKGGAEPSQPSGIVNSFFCFKNLNYALVKFCHLQKMTNMLEKIDPNLT